jgi:hypothetical protein
MIVSSPILESIRLSRSGVHQAFVVVLQSVAESPKVRLPGVIVKISEEATHAAELARQGRESEIVMPTSAVSKYDTYHPYNRSRPNH